MDDRNEQHRRPIWLGVVITPLLTPLAFFLVAACFLIATGQHDSRTDWAGFLEFSYIFGVPLGYAAFVVLGMPLIFALRRHHRLTVFGVCLGAACIASAVFTLFTRIAGSQFADLPQAALMGAVMGLLAGLIFCGLSGISFRAPQRNT